MAGTNNFQVWNPGKANQEDDATYAADAMRTGGAGVNAIFAHALANKLFYQVTVFVAAFAQMMAAKNYNMQDGDINALAGVLANIFTNADNNGGLLVVPYSATPTFDASKSSIFVITLTGDVTSSTLTNCTAGRRLLFHIIQDGNGGHKFTYPPNVIGESDVDTDPNTHNTQEFLYLANGNAYATTPSTVATS